MSSKGKNEPEFDELEALQELQGYFIIALHTQNFEFLERQIENWKVKYPLNSFKNPEILRKIKYLLSRDFLSQLLGDYLASKILQDKQKQQKYYDSLEKIIDEAETSPNNNAYKIAEGKIKRWKAQLKADGMSLYGFNRYYSSKIFKLLIIPRNKLKEADGATRDLKQIYDKSNKLNSDDLSNEITKWQDHYCVENFKEGLRAELNEITSDIMKSIADKQKEEKCNKELDAFAKETSLEKPFDTFTYILAKYDPSEFSKDTQERIKEMTKQFLQVPDYPEEFDESSEEIDSILSKGLLTVTEESAIKTLREILRKNPRNMSAILEWMYKTSKLHFSEQGRNEIAELFLRTNYYKMKEQSSYHIPVFNTSFLNDNISTIRTNFLDFVSNYIGIMVTGKSLTQTEKENIAGANATALVTEMVVSQPNPLDNTQNVGENSADILPQPEELSVRPTPDGTIEIEVAPNALYIPVFDTIPGKTEETQPEVDIADFLTNPNSRIMPINQHPEKEKPKQDSEEIRPEVLFVIDAFSNDEHENDPSKESKEVPGNLSLRESNDTSERVEENNPGTSTTALASTMSAEEEPSITFALPEQDQETIKTNYDTVGYIELSAEIIAKAQEKDHSNDLSLAEKEILAF